VASDDLKVDPDRRRDLSPALPGPEFADLNVVRSPVLPAHIPMVSLLIAQDLDVMRQAFT
jgi:hypothetical protein